MKQSAKERESLWAMHQGNASVYSIGRFTSLVNATPKAKLSALKKVVSAISCIA